MINLQLKMRLILTRIIINSNFLDGLEAPDDSVLKTIQILEEKK